MELALKNGAYSAKIDPLGAQLISFRDDKGTEYIWQRDPEIWAKSSPLLFPIVGAARDGRLLIDGKYYPMEKHGFCKDRVFTVSEQTAHSAVLSLTDDERTRQSYPYHFRLSLRYTLSATGLLSFLYRVQNTGARELFYCIGAHPGFRCPLQKDRSFTDYSLFFEKEEDTASVVYDAEKACFVPEERGVILNHTKELSLAHSLFARDAVYFDRIRSRAVSLLDRERGCGVRVAFPDFETAAFWTAYPAEASFLCIEPWNGSAYVQGEDDALCHKNHVQKLLPGAEKIYRLEIELIKGR